jgi:NAD(P)H-nitrite reductase large subunit
MVPNPACQETPAKPALQDGEKGVVIQRDRQTYAIAPHIPCGLITPELLRKIADVAERYGCQALKLTSAERIALIGLREQDIDAVWSELGLPVGGLTGDCVRSVRVCAGIEYCKRAQQDSIALGKALDAKYHAQPMPGKLKIAVAGCPNQCTETATKDIGVVGTRQGWDLWVGGCGGSNPRLAVRVARNCTSATIERLVEGVVGFYKTRARSRERLNRTLAREGIAALTDELGLDRVEAESSLDSSR